MVDLNKLRSDSVSFAQRHLVECAKELVEWRETSLLCNGRVRELGRMCSEFVGKDHGLKMAESLVKNAALDALAKGVKGDAA